MFIRQGFLLEEAGDEGEGGTPPLTPPAPTTVVDQGDPPKPGMTDKERELLAESMTRKARIKELEAAAAKTAESLKAWEGLNPEEVRKLVQQQKEAELKSLEKKGEFDKVRAQILEAHEGEKKTLQQKIDELQGTIGQMAGQVEQLTVGQAFATSKFIGEQLVLTPSKARTIYGAYFERDAEGSVVGYDRPRGSSDRAPFVDGQGNPLPFDQALTKLIEADPDKDSLLRAKVRQGADSGTSAGRGAGTEPATVAGISRITSAIKSGGLKKSARS